jgi:hypothetical protein
MSWTVHGLHGKLLTFNIKAEHGIFVVQSMARRVPQVEVVNVWRNDLIITTFPVLVSNEVNQLFVDASTMWKPEGTSWRQVVEHYKILLGGDTSVISFLCLYWSTQ